MNRILVAAGVFAISLCLDRAAADVPLTGFFIAREACPALQSIRKETNPGAVQTEPNRSYPLLSKNKPAASHYMIEIAGAEPSRRWVAVTCGEHVVSADGSTPPPKTSEEEGGGGLPSSKQPAYVLSVSWQPAFCEGKSDKTECKTQSAGRFDATHFTLHGLWPQPGSNIFCHVSPDLVAADKNKEWDKLPAPKLEAATRKSLEEVMPGTASNLERHEWIKHGSCFQGESADAYFSRALALMAQLNGSKARELFASHIGSEITNAAIKDAFDESFGAGSGDRVRVSCKRDGSRNLIVELTIGLVGEIDDEPSFAELVAASSPTDPGCPRGIVDPVGLQ
ncbi:ribonuclease T [Beijerinckiaceae bacterium]|nr:ribonuclease T [Beijerinckiaceae bacterium]